MSQPSNPFERWNLDPRASTQQLTRNLKKIARRLDPEEKQELQRDWRRLTSDPVFRARWAMLTPTPVDASNGPDLWKSLNNLVDPKAPDLPALEPTLADALVLPTLKHVDIDLAPPFLPPPLRDAISAPEPGDDA